MVGLVLAETRRSLNSLNWRRVKEAVQSLESLFGLETQTNRSSSNYYRSADNNNCLLWLQYDNELFYKYSTLFCKFFF